MRKKQSASTGGVYSEHRSLLVGSLLVIAFISAIILVLFSNSYNQTKKISMQIISESASQSSAKLKNSVDSAADRLEGLASILASESEFNENKASAIAASLSRDSLFSSLAIKLSNGTAINGKGETLSGIQWNEEVSLSPDRSNVTISKKTTSQTTSQEIIRMFTPIGDTQNYLYGIIETDFLSKNYISSGFGGNSAIIVFEADNLGILFDTGSGFDLPSNALGALDKLVFANGYSKSSFYSDINKNKSGNTIISTRNGKMACSYLPVGISNWYIMQIVPESILFSHIYKNTLPFVCVLLVAVVLFIFAFWVNIKASKFSVKAKNVSYKENVREGILANALSDSLMRVFLYYRNTDTVVVLKSAETSRRAEQSGEIKNGLDYIIKSDSLSNDDARKLRNAFNLSGPGKVKKLTVCSHRGSDEIFLRYTLTRSKDETGKENIIIATARDVTELEKTKQKQLDIESFRSTIVNYNTTGIEIFLESGRWRIMWNNEPLFSSLAGTGSLRTQYDTDLENSILPLIHPSDKNAFSGVMNRLNLLSDFRKGASEKTLQYRIKTEESDEQTYGYRVLEIRTLRDKASDEAKADIYIRNVEKNDLEKYTDLGREDMEYRMAQGIFSCLSGSCTRAGFAELYKNSLYIISSDGKTLCKKASALDFKNQMYTYANEYIHPEDRCAFITNNSKEYLQAHLTESSQIVTHYRVKLSKDSDEYASVFSAVKLVLKTDNAFEVTIIEQTL